MAKPTEISQEEMLQKAMTSPALKWQSPGPGRSEYPANYRGRVPLKVKLAKNVIPDLPTFGMLSSIPSDTVAHKDIEYFVWVNGYGAVSAILPNGNQLGLLPSEFDVTEWHEPSATSNSTQNQTP